MGVLINRGSETNSEFLVNGGRQNIRRESEVEKRLKIITKRWKEQQQAAVNI